MRKFTMAIVAGDRWGIQGRDTSGRYMTLYIDAKTGEVRNLYR